MTVPLDRLYHFVEDIAQRIFEDCVIIYRFYPHGSKNINNMTQLKQHAWTAVQLCPALYCNDQEPLDYDYYETVEKPSAEPFRPLPHFLKAVPVYNKFLLLHSEQHSDEVKKYQQDRFIPVYWWSHAVIARDWFRYAQHLDVKKRSRKTFLIYNRAWSGTREYRLKFAELVLETGLGDQCQTSISPVEPELGQHYHSYQFKNPAWRPHTVLEDYFPVNTAASHYSADFDIDDYDSTDIEVVLETLFDDKRWHLTEKSLRPIALGQPFILAGTAGSLAYLRSYGFKTFGNIWDEHYDLITDPEKRLQAIVDLMNQIANCTPEIREKKLAQAQAIADYNKRHFFSQAFFDRIVDELTTNLKIGLDQVAHCTNYQGWLDHWDRKLANPDIVNYLADRHSPFSPNLPDIDHIKTLIHTKLNTP